MGSLVAKEGQKSPAECLFSKVILSLPAPDVSNLFPEEELIEATGTFGTTPAGLKLKISALEDYKLASKAFSDFLYPTDATKLVTEPLKIKR